jgi:hypothetical protein
MYTHPVFILPVRNQEHSAMQIQVWQDRGLHVSTSAHRQLVPAGALICSASCTMIAAETSRVICAARRAAASLYASRQLVKLFRTSTLPQALPWQQPFTSYPTECSEHMAEVGHS